MFYFISFVDVTNQDNSGCIQIKSDNPTEAMKDLGARLEEVNDGGAFHLLLYESPKPDKDLELNKIYSRKEMIKKGYISEAEARRRVQLN